MEEEKAREIIKVLIKKLSDKGMDTKEITEFVGMVARLIYAGGHIDSDGKSIPIRISPCEKTGLDEEIFNLIKEYVISYSFMIPNHLNIKQPEIKTGGRKDACQKLDDKGCDYCEFT